MNDNKNFKSAYADVNGLHMYYEIQGAGKPLVLVHGGGSNMQTSFEKIIPGLAKHRQIIAMDLQAHGRTNDREAELSFDQDADDVAALCKSLEITKADFLGFSNGGQTIIALALRHPGLINKIIIASAFYKRAAAAPQFWEGFHHATLDHMPQPLKDAYLSVTNNDQAGLQNMFSRDIQRMKTFTGWTDEEMQKINAPTLIINGNNDVGSLEHSLEMVRILPNAELAVFPGGHGAYLGVLETLVNGKWPAFNATYLVEEFLDK